MQDTPPTAAELAQRRRAEFNSLFEALPGKNIDRIRAICSVLGCKPNTVRVYRLRTKPKTIPEFKLRVLREALGEPVLKAKAA